MDTKTFLDNFVVIAEAPGGVKRLRQMVLDLAVGGRLVEHDPSEQPATVGLEKIAAHRKSAIRDLSLRIRTAPEPVGPRQTPRVVPDGWAEVQLTDALLVVMGNSPPGDSYNERGDGVPLINGPVEFSPPPLGRTVLRQFTTAPTRLCIEGDMLVCVRGATTGRTNIAGFDACIGRGVALVRGWDAQPFVNLLMWNLGSHLLAAGKGTTFPSISYDDLAKLWVLIPPLAEQERIVAKVDELMGLCDELESRQERRHRATTRFRASALGALTDAGTADELGRAWGRVNTNWRALTDSPDSIKDLRHAILRLAVQGRLVAQDPAEAPADDSEAVWRDLDRNKLWELHGTAHLPAAWARRPMSSLGKWGSGGTPAKSHPEYYGGTIPWVVIGDLNDDILTDAESTITEAGLAESSAKLIPAGAVLIAMYGASIGKTGVTGIECATNQAIAHCVPDLTAVTTPFLWTLARTLKAALVSAGKGAAQPNISQTVLKHLVVQVPPIREQQRILVRIDALMTLCDEIEGSLARQDHAQGRLSSGLLHLV